MKIKGATIVVAGGSAGLGLAAAKEFARKKAGVLILLARRQERLDAAARLIQDEYAGVKVYTRSVDLRDEAAVKAMADGIKGEFGAPDILAYSAAGGFLNSIDEESSENVRLHMESTYYGAFYIVKTFVEDFVRRNSGHIVFFNSPIHYLPCGQIGYYASRAALAAFARALHEDLSDTNIGVTLAEPGILYAQDTGYFGDYPGCELRLPFSGTPMLGKTITYSAGKIARSAGKAIEASRFLSQPFMIRVAAWFGQSSIRGLYARILRMCALPYEQGGPLSGNRRRLGLIQKSSTT